LNAEVGTCFGSSKLKHELFHHLLIIDSIPNVDVGLIRYMGHSRIQVEDVRRFSVSVQIRVDLLDKCRFASTSHSNRDDGHSLFLALRASGCFWFHRCWSIGVQKPVNEMSSKTVERALLLEGTGGFSIALCLRGLVRCAVA
jgi:hypothetical protein